MKTTTDINRVTGQRIQRLRQIIGLSRRELASGVGVTQQQIQNYETGKVGVSIKRLHKVAETLKTHPTKFLSDDIENEEAAKWVQSHFPEFDGLLEDICKIDDRNVMKAFKKLTAALREQKELTDE